MKIKLLRISLLCVMFAGVFTQTSMNDNLLTPEKIGEPEPGDPICVVSDNDTVVVEFNGTFTVERNQSQQNSESYRFDVCYITMESEGEGQSVQYTGLECSIIMNNHVDTQLLNKGDLEEVQLCQDKISANSTNSPENATVTNTTESVVLQVVSDDRKVVTEINVTDKVKLKVRSYLTDQDYGPPVVSDCWYHAQPDFLNDTGTNGTEEEKEWIRWLDDGCTLTSQLYKNRMGFVSAGRVASQLELAVSLDDVTNMDSKARFYNVEFRCEVYMCFTDQECSSRCRGRRGQLTVPRSVEVREVSTSVSVDLLLPDDNDNDSDGGSDADNNDDDDRDDGLIVNTKDPVSNTKSKVTENEDTALQKYMPYFVLATLATVALVMLLLLYLVCHIGCSRVEPEPDYPSANEDDITLQQQISMAKVANSSHMTSLPAYSSKSALLTSPGERSSNSTAYKTSVGLSLDPVEHSRISATEISHHTAGRSYDAGIPSRYQDGPSPRYNHTGELSYLNRAHHEFFGDP